MKISGIVIIAVLLTSCAISTPNVGGGGKVSYGDSNTVETVSTDFGSTDLNIVTKQIAAELIASGKINQCKTYTVSAVRNKTDQYINTENITQGIVEILGNSPQVKSTYVLSTQEMQNQREELPRQNSSGLYNNKLRVGQMQGAACRIDGFVSDISKDNGQIKNVFYLFNLKLINIEQGSMLWVGEKKISKK